MLSYLAQYTHHNCYFNIVAYCDKISHLCVQGKNIGETEYEFCEGWGKKRGIATSKKEI